MGRDEKSEREFFRLSREMAWLAWRLEQIENCELRVNEHCSCDDGRGASD
jgi:hypothetical protein